MGLWNLKHHLFPIVKNQASLGFVWDTTSQLSRSWTRGVQNIGTTENNMCTWDAFGIGFTIPNILSYNLIKLYNYIIELQKVLIQMHAATTQSPTTQQQHTTTTTTTTTATAAAADHNNNNNNKKKNDCDKRHRHGNGNTNTMPPPQQCRFPWRWWQ